MKLPPNEFSRLILVGFMAFFAGYLDMTRD
jgi:hypothetical protein